MLKYICFTFNEFKTNYPFFLKEFLTEYEDNTEILFLNKLNIFYSKCVSFTENPSILNIGNHNKLNDTEFNFLKNKISSNKIIVEYKQNTDGYIRYIEKSQFEKLSKNYNDGGYIFTVISEKNISEYIFNSNVLSLHNYQHEIFNLDLSERYTASFNRIIQFINNKINSLKHDNIKNTTHENKNSNYPFLTLYGKKLFEKYLKANTDFNEISFIFYRLTEKNPPDMVKMKYREYIDWLKEKEYITKKEYEKLENKTSLNKKSNAQFRLDRLNEIESRLKEAE